MFYCRGFSRRYRGGAHAASVDLQNENLSGGTTNNALLSSNGGLGVDNFSIDRDSDSNALVGLRARNDGDGGPVSKSGDTFTIRPKNGDEDNRFQFDFQFSPKNGDAVDGNNYFVELKIDEDPSKSVSFNTTSGVVFDDDDENDLTEDPGSWDDHDSLVIDGDTERGEGNNTYPRQEVSFVDGSGDRNDLPEWVLVNSWTPEWDFLGTGEVFGPGLYDLELTASEYSGGSQGSEVASQTITTKVAPLPSSVWGGVALLSLAGGGAVVRRMRRISAV